MKKFFNKYFWTLLIVIAALGLAGSAAYFSISGLSKLFAGSAMHVIIMASFIEFAKLATTAALHRYWKQTKWWMKYTLTAMVISVMIITSSGIYGFLADAYSSTSTQLDKIQGKIELIEKQQEQKKIQILGIEELKNSKSERINSLIDVRGQQESRIDSLYAKSSYSNAKKTQKLIDESTNEIQKLQAELDSSISKINRISEEIGELDIEILELQNSDVASEIGPLKYMSTVVNRPMEDIINWFILMLIFVFDPLAVLLVIFASNIYDANNKDASEIVLVEKINEPDVIDNQEKFSGDNMQNIVNAINNTDDESIDFKYDFPEEKGEEVVEYVENGSGGFKKNEEPSESFSTLIKGIDSNPIYLQLLDVLFLDGERVQGDVIPPYKTLVKNIADRGIICQDKEIKNFLTICNLLDITNMSDKDNVKIIKDYSVSKGIISLVSK